MDGYAARFNGIGRLFSPQGQERLKASHVCVVGLGGVGSWAVESLARSGIGELTLIDLDDVCISNVNRQLHAVKEELGKPKTDAMARRVLAINPECRVHAVQAFFLKSNARELLAPDFDYVVDAIDSPSRKALLIGLCKERGIPVVTTGAAGGRRDPTQLRTIDLAFSSQDRLLQQVRKTLRCRHGFPRGDLPFGVECIASTEPVTNPSGEACGTGATGPDLRLDCQSGFGTASFVTGAFGLAAASRVVIGLVSGIKTKSGSAALR